MLATRSVQNAYREGREAQLNGVAVDDNPYVVSKTSGKLASKLRFNWFMGWYDSYFQKYDKFKTG